MEPTTVTTAVGDTEVQITETEDGFEIEPVDAQSQAHAAVEQFIADHEALTTYKQTEIGPDYYVGFALDDLRPGLSALGNGRNDAEVELNEAGYEVELTLIEEIVDSDRYFADADVLVGMDVVETDT